MHSVYNQNLDVNENKQKYLLVFDQNILIFIASLLLEMEGETPRTLIRGVLQASYGTRSSHRQLRQTPLASTRNRESPRLSRSASVSLVLHP